MHYSDTASFKKKRTAAREKLKKAIVELAKEYDLTEYAVAHAICDSVLSSTDNNAFGKAIPNGLAETYLPYVLEAATASNKAVHEGPNGLNSIIQGQSGEIVMVDDLPHFTPGPAFQGTKAKKATKHKPTWAISGPYTAATASAVTEEKLKKAKAEIEAYISQGLNKTYYNYMIQSANSPYKSAPSHAKAVVHDNGNPGYIVLSLPNLKTGVHVNLPLNKGGAYNMTGQALNSMGLTFVGLQYVLAGVGHGFTVEQLADKDMVAIKYLGPDSPVQQGLPGYVHSDLFAEHEKVVAVATKPPYHAPQLIIGGQVSEAVIAQYGLTLPDGYYFTEGAHTKADHLLVTQEPF